MRHARLFGFSANRDLSIGAITIVTIGLIACASDDDGTGPQPPAGQTPTYTLVDTEVWAGSQVRLSWSDGDLAPTAAYLDSVRLGFTFDSPGQGHVEVPNDMGGPTVVRVVTDQHEDTVGTVNVLGFAWQRSADAPFFEMGYARNVDGAASVIANSGTFNDSAFPAELRLPEGTVTRLIPHSYDVSDEYYSPGRTPDPDRILVPAPAIQEWRVEPNAELLQEVDDAQSFPYRVVQRLNDTMYVALSKREVVTFTIVDGVRRRLSLERLDEGSEVRPSPDFEWFVPRMWGADAIVYSTGTGMPAFRVPMYLPRGIAFTTGSDTVYLAGPAAPFGTPDSVFAYTTSDGGRIAQRAIEPTVRDMVADPERPLLYVIGTSEGRIELRVLDRLTLETVGYATGPLALEAPEQLYFPVAALDAEYIYLVFGRDYIAFDRPTD